MCSSNEETGRAAILQSLGSSLVSDRPVILSFNRCLSWESEKIWVILGLNCSAALYFALPSSFWALTFRLAIQTLLQPNISLYKSFYNCVWWQFSSAEVWICPHLHTILSLSLLCLHCWMTPSKIENSRTHLHVGFFYQTALELHSVKHSFSHSFMNPLWFQLR